MNRLLRMLIMEDGDKTYEQKLKSLFGSSIVGYWPLDDPAGSTVARDASGNGFSGVHAQATPGYPGLGDGRTSTLYAGVGSSTNVYSTKLVEVSGFEKIYNPGFETSPLAKWSSYAGNGAISEESTFVHSGNYAAKLVAGADKSANLSQLFYNSSNYTYTISFWTRGDGTNAGMYGIYDITNSAYAISKRTTGVTGTVYQQVTFQYTPPSGCNSSFIYLFCPNVVSGEAYFDDVSVTTTSGNGINREEGTHSAWGKVSQDSVWSDGIVRYQLYGVLRAGGALQPYIDGAAGGIDPNIYTASTYCGSVTRQFVGSNWFNICITWSKSSNRYRTYINGQLTYEGVYKNDILLTSALIGKNWDGYLCHELFLNKEASASDVINIATIKNNLGAVSILGDSISASALIAPWNLQTTRNLQGTYRYNNHAVGSMGILAGASNMAVQVAASANDYATIIIIELGTNDNPAGDMNALQSAVENGIDTLRSTNPRATIYYLNILPEWTNSGGGTEIDNHIIRARIAAACANKNVVCWDTYAENWIVASDTSDGTHPTEAGHAKIAAQVLARLQ